MVVRWREREVKRRALGVECATRDSDGPTFFRSPARGPHGNWYSGGLTFFRSAARGHHVPADLTRESTKHEARKRRASERPRVGCCEELGRGCRPVFAIAKSTDQTTARITGLRVAFHIFRAGQSRTRR